MRHYYFPINFEDDEHEFIAIYLHFVLFVRAYAIIITSI